jgi:hypothetical protein
MFLFSYFSNSKTPPNLAWVFVMYSFVGVSEGSYGPNMLNVVHDLGNARLYVILAIPVGVSLITIVGFGLMSIGVPFQCFYYTTGIFAIISIILYFFTIYRYSEDDEALNSSNFSKFIDDLYQIKQWFGKMTLHSIVFIFNMACLSLFNPGCTLYLYQSRVKYQLFDVTISNSLFILFYNLGNFLGDFVSRKVMDKGRIINPLWFMALLLLGLSVNLSLIPEIAPLAAFLFSWANGGLYCQTTKKFSNEFQDDYHLTATSVWLFFGDCGSTAGSSLIQFVRPWVGSMKQKMY